MAIRLPLRRLSVPLVAVLLLLVALVAGPGARAAAGVASTENVTARLIAERTAFEPGAENWLILHQKIRPGWHTYWLNPGDSGLPTTLQWTLPEGFSAGPIVWPAPHYFEVGGLANHGYADSVGLLVPVRVPAEAAGGRARLSVKADWLVCETICVPESVELSLDLPVGNGRQAIPVDMEAAPLFAAARAEVPAPLDGAAFAVSGGRLSLALPPGAVGDDAVRFFALSEGTIAPAAPQAARMAGDRLVLDLVLAEGATAPARLDGVLVAGEAPRRAFAIAAETGPVPAPPPSGGAGALALLPALLLAFGGGLLLNLMPCVLPVLSIKALAFVGHEADAPWKLRAHGLAYGAGVLATFALVGGIVLALRAGGAEIGWGFQLQSPFVVALLAYLLFAVGLALSGVLGISAGRLSGMGQGLAGQAGLAGAFFTGALAVVVATPCTAPFMAAALGFAFVAPWFEAMAVFLALGLGLAAPFVILAFSPPLVRLLPRPGAWMERLRQFLAFPMFASVAWLVWVLGRQAGADAVFAILVGLVLIAFGAWALGAAGQARGAIWPQLARGAALLALVGAFALARLPEPEAGDGGSPRAEGEVQWQAYDPARLDALRAEGRPVFLNATAAWCLSCLVNERVALSDKGVLAAFREREIVPVEADWTRRDPAITALLAAHGRSGVPLYLFYPPGGGAPVELPQILTPDLVIATISGR